MLPRPLIRTLGALAGLALLALAWFLLAPPALGGKTSIVVTSGNSMEPRISKGDLVIARERPSYGVGDVVLFRSATLGRRVLHRIVAVEGGRFVTKGDNNDYRDPERVSPSRVDGEAALLLPGVGKPVAWLRHPLNAAVALFLLVSLSLAGGREAARRRPSPARHLPRGVDAGSMPTVLATERAAAAARTALLGASIALLLFGLLALVAWRAPDTQAAPSAQAYEHAGSFSYSAGVRPSIVYPDGRLETGDAAFTRLVRRLDVAFDYRFETRRRHDVRGGIALDAVIGDGSGWERTVTLDSVAPFDGGAARTQGVLDLRRLEALGARMRALTGSSTSTFTVTLRPRVQVSGYAGSAVLDETFAPELRFVLDPLALRLESGDQRSALEPREQGSVLEQRDAAIGVGKLSLPVAEARALSALGVAVALLVALGAAVLLVRRVDGSEADRIEARYGDRIVPGATVIPDSRWVTDLPDFDSLLRLADRYDRVVLRTVEGSRHAYLVDDGVAVYRYHAGSDAAGAPGLSPLPGRS